MSDDDAQEYLATANAVSSLAERGLAAVHENDHAEAVMLYNLVQQFSRALVLTATVHSSNELKQQVLPEEFLREEHTGATHPLTDPGQYL